MPFKEMMVDEPVVFATIRHGEEEQSLLKVILNNNGPILTLWFVVMALNILGLIFIF